MIVAAAMATVHEQMHQRAEQKKRVGQYPQQMRPVLGDEKEAKHEHCDREHRPEPTRSEGRSSGTWVVPEGAKFGLSTPHRR
jgi:hypothetical protein